MYNVLQTYVDLLKEKCLSSNKMLTRLELNGLWVNLMKKVEYNPPHLHDGDISWVIYSSIPSEILEKKKILKVVVLLLGTLVLYMVNETKHLKLNLVLHLKKEMFIYFMLH